METKYELIASIADVAARLAARFAEEDADEQTHLRQLCSPEAQRILATMSVQELHLLDAVVADGEGARSRNIVALARATGAPKGTVSKRIQRLTEAGAVARYQLPGNRKEVHLRLTPVGEEIQAAHRSLHEEMGDVLDEFLARYSPDELRILTRVLNDLLLMPRDGVRFRPDLLDLSD